MSVESKRSLLPFSVKWLGPFVSTVFCLSSHTLTDILSFGTKILIFRNVLLETLIEKITTALFTRHNLEALACNFKPCINELLNKRIATKHPLEKKQHECTHKVCAKSYRLFPGSPYPSNILHVD